MVNFTCVWCDNTVCVRVGFLRELWSLRSACMHTHCMKIQRWSSCSLCTARSLRWARLWFVRACIGLLCCEWHPGLRCTCLVPAVLPWSVTPGSALYLPGTCCSVLEWLFAKYLVDVLLSTSDANCAVAHDAGTSSSHGRHDTGWERVSGDSGAPCGLFVVFSGNIGTENDFQLIVQSLVTGWSVWWSVYIVMMW